MASIPALLASARSSREFVVGIIVGAAYAASVTPIRGACVDNMMTAASLGVPAVGVASVIVFPLLSGRHAVWNAEEMRNLFPATNLADPTDVANINSTHGRGIYLMRALMDDVHFEQGGTEVHLRKSSSSSTWNR
jgi:hypothetical protein